MLQRHDGGIGGPLLCANGLTSVALLALARRRRRRRIVNDGFVIDDFGAGILCNRRSILVVFFFVGLCLCALRCIMQFSTQTEIEHDA